MCFPGALGQRQGVSFILFFWGGVPLLLGSTWQEKVSTVRSYMKNHTMAPTALLLSALDETACEWGFRSASGSCSLKHPPGPRSIQLFLKQQHIHYMSSSVMDHRNSEGEGSSFSGLQNKEAKELQASGASPWATREME